MSVASLVIPAARLVIRSEQQEEVARSVRRDDHCIPGQAGGTGCLRFSDDVIGGAASPLPVGVVPDRV